MTLVTLAGDGGFEFAEDEVIDVPAVLDGLNRSWILLAYLDSDDSQDFAIAATDGVETVQRGTSPTFRGFDVKSLGGIALARFDADGDTDIAYTRDAPTQQTPGLVRRLNDGTGYFGTDFSPAEAVPGAGALGVGDFDTNGAMDAAYVVDDGRVAIQLGTGAATFSDVEWLEARPSPSALLVADLNGDKHPDLVVSYTTEKSISIFPGDGSGGFGERRDIPIAMAMGRPSPRSRGSVSPAAVSRHRRPSFLPASENRGRRRSSPAVAGKPTYSRRRPEQGAQHQVVRDNLRRWFLALSLVEGADHGYPADMVDGVPAGVETPAMIAWLRYWIYDDQGARNYFYGDDCVMCSSPWTNTQRKNLD